MIPTTTRLCALRESETCQKSLALTLAQRMLLSPGSAQSVSPNKRVTSLINTINV